MTQASRLDSAFTNASVFGLLEHVGATVPGRTAMLDEAGNALTFGAWLRRSTDLSMQLAGAGVGKGDRVALVYDRAQWISFCVSYFALQRLGAVPVAVPESALDAEREHISSDASIKLWLASGSATQNTLKIQGLPQPELSSCIGVREPAVVERSAIADIIYTSGTTGAPKAVATPHGLIRDVYSELPSAAGRTGPPILHFSPVGTGAALMMVFAPFQGIGREVFGEAMTRAVLTMSAFDVEKVSSSVERHGINLMFVTPAHLASLLRATGTQLRRLRTLDTIHCGSAPLNSGQVDRLRSVLPKVHLLNAYGTTESWPGALGLLHVPGRSMFTAHPGPLTELRVRDPLTSTSPLAGHSGRIEIRSSVSDLRRTYLQDSTPSATFLEDGWIATGDAGVVQDDGSVEITGRLSDVINVGGMKLAARDPEKALMTHPLVEDAAVLGLPHPRLGEYVVAAIVTVGTFVTRAEIRAYLSEILPAHAVPRRYFVTDRLPTTITGKVKKPDLIQRLRRGDRSLSEIF